MRMNTRRDLAASTALALIILAGCGTSVGKSAPEQGISDTPRSSVARTTTRAAAKRTVAPTTVTPTTVTPTTVARKIVAPTIVAPTTIAHVASPVPQPPVTVATPFSPRAISPPNIARSMAPANIAPSSAAEGSIVAGINIFRRAHGLPALAVHGVLASKARGWAAHMATGGCGRGGGDVANVCHSMLSNRITVPWVRLAENVGLVSPTTNVSGMQGAFEQSPSHAENMLNNQMQYVGVGVSYVDNYMYVAQEFMGT
jgi:uncharacterized protein YkwD